MESRRFASAISNHASKVKWERANRCTCWNLESGQPTMTCKACDGTGYTYLPPVFEADGILVTGLVLTKEFNGMGDWKMGDLVATIAAEVRRQPTAQSFFFEDNPLFPAGEWDKFTLVDAMFRSHETLVRGEAQQKRPADTLRYEGIATNDDGTPAVDFVLTANPSTGEVTYYTVETDFTVVGNKIDWVAGRGPVPGAQYSVTYWHNPVYIVYNQLPQSRDGIEGQHMPRKLILRYRDDL
jgi:hypothetical protein